MTIDTGPWLRTTKKRWKLMSIPVMGQDHRLLMFDAYEYTIAAAIITEVLTNTYNAKIKIEWSMNHSRPRDR